MDGKDSCPSGGGDHSSEGRVRAFFVVLNEHAQGHSRPSGKARSGFNECVVPSRHTFIASEAVLVYFVENMPSALRVKKNIYVAQTVTMAMELRKKSYVRRHTIEAVEFFRLNFGVAAMADHQLASAPYDMWCSLKVSVFGSLSLVQIKMPPGEEMYPDFMAQKRTESVSEGYDGGESFGLSRDVPVAGTGGATINHAPGSTARGRYSWSARPDHCDSTLVPHPVSDSPAPDTGPDGGGAPTDGGEDWSPGDLALEGFPPFSTNILPMSLFPAHLQPAVLNLGLTPREIRPFGWTGGLSPVTGSPLAGSSRALHLFDRRVTCLRPWPDDAVGRLASRTPGSSIHGSLERIQRAPYRRADLPLPERPGPDHGGGGDVS